MAKDNISYTTLRLNTDNPKQLRAIQILNNLNPEVHKNKTQFILSAIEFYIDHYGDEYFKNGSNKEQKSYICKEEMQLICERIKEEAATAARVEVIRLLGDKVVGVKREMQEPSKSKIDSQTANAILEVALDFDDYDE